MERLKWPLYCFVAVAFWNMLGAGVFGFLINPPISLYYIQGLNTTPFMLTLHYSVYTVFLALGFVFLIARYLRLDTPFNDKLMKWGFWLLNGGLVLMIVSSLYLSVLFKVMQVSPEGLWYARSEDLCNNLIRYPTLGSFRWRRCLHLRCTRFLLANLTMVFFKPKKQHN